MRSPMEVYQSWKNSRKPQWRMAFWSTMVIGLLVHGPIMLRDIPNHDGLASMYFDQNMITSGRWFLGIACGISSYFTVPWLIGLLGIFYLALAAVAVTEVLEIKHTGSAWVIGGLLASFPALASAFAYVFTLDGYMLGLLLAVLAVFTTKKWKKGFWMGGVLLAFSLGIYQSYLPFAMLFSLYCIVLFLLENHTLQEKIKKTLSYLGMGIIGSVLYLLLLHILLLLQGKELDTYQGINGMTAASSFSLLESIQKIYTDFVSFTLKGGVLFGNVFGGIAILLLAAGVLYTLAKVVKTAKLWKNIWFYLVLFFLVLALPVATNVILIISPNVQYHLLMRYQWVVYPMVAVGLLDRFGKEEDRFFALGRWICVLASGVLIFTYALQDNIGYSNLEKRYEKTYAYCLRLLDRMEQTEGYYQGIPIAMIGVVGEEQYPVTDITEKVTGNMIGLSGDTLLYTAANYQAFFKHFFGVEINVIEGEQMLEIYDSAEYLELDSFPGANAMKVVNGILYIKTENQH